MTENKKPVGFRLEGQVAGDGGEITFYEVDKNLHYGERVLAFCYVRERKRLLRKPMYQARVDIRNRDDILGQDFQFPECISRREVVFDIIDFIYSSMDRIDPAREKSVDVRPLDEGSLCDYIEDVHYRFDHWLHTNNPRQFNI